MASVTEIVPEPAESTFNITGLTLDEIIFLRDLLGMTSNSNTPGYDLYELISDQVPTHVHRLRFFKQNGVVKRS